MSLQQKNKINSMIIISSSSSSSLSLLLNLLNYSIHSIQFIKQLFNNNYYCQKNTFIIIFSFWLLLLFHQTITIDAEKQIENNNNVNVNVNASSINTTNQTSITATASSSTTAAANSTNSTFTSKTSSSSSSSNNDNNDDYKQELINFQDDNNINHSYHFHHDFDEQKHIHRPSSSLSFIDRRKDVRGKFVSQIVNRASQAFQNLLEHRRNRSRPRLVKLMTERRSSVGRRLLPRVREHLAQHFESFRPKTLLSPPPSPPPPPPPEPLPQLSEQLVEEDLPLPNDIQFAESRIDGNETSSNRHDNNVWNIYDHQQQPQNHHHHQLLQTFPEPQINYEIEGQKLRQDIVNKVGNLQTILETAFHVTRQRRDQFLSRLLQNTNNRLERAKNRADQILSEPVTSELAVRTLHHINQGINNANLFLYNLLNRIDVSIKVQMKNSPQTPAAAAAAATTTTTTLPANISSNENGSNKNNGTATTTTTSH